MACTNITLKGINTGCKDSMGGIKEVYLIKDEDVTGIALDGLGQNATIGTITLGSEAKFSTYKFRKGTSDMVSTLTTDEAAGTLSVETQLNLQFSKQEAGKRLEIMAMCMDSMKAVVRDSNDVYWLLGYDYPITASAATSNTGKAFADFNGYNVTLTDNSKEFPFPLSTAAVEALKEQLNPAPVGV